ncbi:MAG: NAD(+)/NADH kinase [Chloroflexi bacterium]|nr:NAD(+)/NADH kinase [Chloroflexota bacterium]HEV8054454.1 NAD(+)/NADH kinase [Candidatus Limnocylindrales bacterium]
MELRRIGFAFNPYNVEARAVLERAHAWCATNRVEAWDARAEDRGAIAEACASGTDLVCVLGGDGTFLRSASAIGETGVPALGINLGRVGFLAKVETDGLEGALDQVVVGDYTVEDRFRIEAAIVHPDGEVVERHACLNEVVVARGRRVRMIRLEVEVSGSHLATYVADAVVVATPTGSTAYSFSAGGSILDPRLRNMIITPVAAYLSPLHSVVAGEDHVVQLTLREASDPAIVSIDGQWDVELAPGDRVEVRALPEPLRLLEPAGATPFYDLLRTKAGLLPY